MKMMSLDIAMHGQDTDNAVLLSQAQDYTEDCQEQSIGTDATGWKTLAPRRLQQCIQVVPFAMHFRPWLQISLIPKMKPMAVFN